MTTPSSMAPTSGASLAMEGVRIRSDDRADGAFMMASFAPMLSPALAGGQAAGLSRSVADPFHSDRALAQA